MEKDQKKTASRDQKLLPAPKKIANTKQPAVDEKQNRLFEPISNKNFIISQIIILSTGLILAGLMYLVLQRPFAGNPDIGKYIPVTKEPISFNLEVVEPENNTVVFDDKILVNGTTSPNATIMISTEDSDQGLNANKEGLFSKTIDLNPGLNTIVINTFNDSGENKSEIRSVYYSEEKL